MHGAVRFPLSPQSSRQPEELQVIVPMLQRGEPRPRGAKILRQKRPGEHVAKVSGERQDRNHTAECLVSGQENLQGQATPTYLTYLPKISRAAQALGRAASFQLAPFLLPAVTSEVPRVCQLAGAGPARPSDFRFLRAQPPSQCQSPVPSSPLSLFWATIHGKPIQLGSGPIPRPEPLFTRPKTPEAQTAGLRCK